MPRPRKAPREHEWLAILAKDELREIVDTLYTELNYEAAPADVLGALVIAGRSLPATVVRELHALYIARERTELAKLTSSDDETPATDG